MFVFRRDRVCRTAALLLTVPLVAGRHAAAQAVYGTIFGTVTDNTGAAVPNATITITDTAKGTSVKLTANQSGEFTDDHLIPDTYTVKVETSGFKSFEQNSIQIFADASVKVTAALEVGSTDQTVSVNADTVPLLKTDRTDVATEFSSKQIVDLPIPDRNFTNLQLLLPGAQLLGWSHAADEDPQGSKQISIDGQSFAGVAYELDGTDNEDAILGIIVINPNADSLSETKIATQNYDAEFGKAVSAVVTAQTKSGTNSLHGSAFDYRESNANLARDPFTQHTTAGFPAGLKNQFGGSLGGPVVKDKIFFFGDYQGVRQKTGQAILQSVPTTQLVSTCLGQQLASNGMAGCDFSQYAVTQGIANGLTPAQAANYQLVYNNSPNNGAGGKPVPYAGNVIPLSQISPQALNLLKLLQPYAPNTNNGGTFGALRNNYGGSGTGGFNSDEWDARGDWTINQNIHAFGRFSRFTDTLTGTTAFGQAGGAGFGLGGYGGSSNGANDSAAAGTDIAINSKLVTDVRLGYFRYNIVTGKYDQGTAFADQLGIPGLNGASSFTSGAPGFILTDAGNFGNTSGDATAQGPQYGSGLNINRCNCELEEREDQYQVVNNWTRLIGNHSVKFGADLRYARNLRVPSDNNRTGLLNFGTGPTGDGTSDDTGLGYATFLLGDVTTFQRYVSSSTNAKEFQKRLYFYAQDTWRATPKLTVNYGTRYEVYFPETVNAPGNGAIMNLNTGYLQVAGIGGIGTNMNQNRPSGTVAPRLGVAYQVNPTTVIRAGYGRSFDIGVFGSVFGHTATQNLPVLATQTNTATNGDTTSDTAYAFNLANGPAAFNFPTIPADGLLPTPGNLLSPRVRPQTLRLPTIDAWNLSVQQAVTPTLSLTLAYVGNKGTHTFGDESGNTVNPNEYGDLLPAENSVNGQGLHYDPTVSQTTVYPGQTIAGISSNNGTANQTFLQRYYGSKLAACSDPDYAAVGGVNAPNGGCGWNQAITYFADNLDTHYNALQVTATQNLQHGVALTFNYSWQQGTSYGTGYSTWDRKAVYGNDSDLRKQTFIVYGTLDLPFGRNHAFLNHSNALVNQIVGGWEVNPVVNWSSGLPFTLSFNNCQASNVSGAPCYVNGDRFSFRSHVTGYPGGPNGLTFYPAFGPANADGTAFSAAGEGTFSQPAVDTFGNVGRNTEYGPRFFNSDLSVQKNFPIRERVTLQLRADGFNAFNKINWGTPNGDIQTGGSIGSGPYPGPSSNPRQMQFSGRVQF